MKVFRHALGHLAGETMTVAELREKLNEYPQDMPVFGGWEGVKGYVRQDSFNVERVGKGHPEDECDCLVIDVETYL
jgi:hypothetical protein